MESIIFSYLSNDKKLNEVGKRLYAMCRLQLDNPGHPKNSGFDVCTLPLYMVEDELRVLKEMETQGLVYFENTENKKGTPPRKIAYLTNKGMEHAQILVEFILNLPS